MHFDGVFELMLLALGLSMDAFAVSIGLGAKHASRGTALKAGLYFGGFQGLMPWLGALGGRALSGWYEPYVPWIACVVLGGIGLKMIWESFGDEIHEASQGLDHRTLLMLAIATSIDAAAAGLSLDLLGIPVLVCCAAIAAVTAMFSAFGVWAGGRGSAALGSRAEVLGGVILVGLGLKLLWLG